MNESDRRARRRWVSLGELIALAALIVSALGLWLTWKSNTVDKTTRVVEQRQAIPLTLRGAVREDGREMAISPVESSHALESLILTMKGAPPIELGSDGTLQASAIEQALKARDKDRKGSQVVQVRIQARYVEAGADRRGGGNYVLRYRWEGGGLFSGASLRLTGLRRA